MYSASDERASGSGGSILCSCLLNSLLCRSAGFQPSAGLLSAVSMRLPGLPAEFCYPRPASHCEEPFSSIAINGFPSHFMSTGDIYQHSLVFFMMGDKDHFFFPLRKVNQ